MELTYENINDKIKEVLNGDQIDLSNVSCLDSVSIQSGEGLIEVDEQGMREEKRSKILGTIAQLTLHY